MVGGSWSSLRVLVIVVRLLPTRVATSSCVNEDLSVRDVEEAIRMREETPAARAAEKSESGRRLRPPGLLELEELLGDFLETRVRITMGPRHGRVQIDFANLEDLERIYRAMTQGARV